MLNQTEPAIFCNFVVLDFLFCIFKTEIDCAMSKYNALYGVQIATELEVLMYYPISIRAILVMQYRWTHRKYWIVILLGMKWAFGIQAHELALNTHP